MSDRVGLPQTAGPTTTVELLSSNHFDGTLDITGGHITVRHVQTRRYATFVGPDGMVCYPVRFERLLRRRSRGTESLWLL